MNEISVIILTFNEEKQIRRCIESLVPFAKEIFVVDSYSTDYTVEIAESLGAKVYQNPWINYAEQFNWALQNCAVKTNWIMRMDADEVVTTDLQNEIVATFQNINETTNAFYVKRRVYFMDKWIKHGGFYPTWLLRIWRQNNGICEVRWMDEHIKVNDVKPLFFKHDIIDNNVNNLTWWINKHNNYTTREVIDLLNIQYNFLDYKEVDPKIFGTQEQRKRWLKIKYAGIPLFIRPVLYFTYRYFIKLGFLDGRRGLIWHFLQGFWYRFLVDAKIYDIKRRMKSENKSVQQLINDYLGYEAIK